VDDSGADVGTEPEVPSAKGTINRKRTIIGGLIAVVFLVLVFARVIPQIGDYQGAFEALGQLTFGELTALFAALVLYMVIYGTPYLVAVPGLSYKHSQIVNNSRFAIGNGIPGGGAFGLAVQYAQLTFYGAPPAAATAAISATGVWATFVTLTLPITGVFALAMSGSDVGRFVVPAIIALTVLLSMIVVFALILRSERNAERIGAFADRIVGGLLRRFAPARTFDASAAVIQLRHDIVGLVSRRWLLITLSNFGVSFGQFLILAVALRTVSADSQNMVMVYGAWAVSQLGILLPVTPGGLGTVDAALIALLTANGVSAADATAATLLWRATTYFPQIIIGVLCIFYWRWEAGRKARASA
jgi:uncharacterized membrane protein YbhN (UPF0104 family)